MLLVCGVVLVFVVGFGWCVGLLFVGVDGGKFDVCLCVGGVVGVGVVFVGLD